MTFSATIPLLIQSYKLATGKQTNMVSIKNDQLRLKAVFTHVEMTDDAK